MPLSTKYDKRRLPASKQDCPPNDVYQHQNPHVFGLGARDEVEKRKTIFFDVDLGCIDFFDFVGKQPVFL